MSSAYGYEVVEAEPGEWSPARGEAPALERVGVGDCVARVIVTRRAGGIPTRVERFFLASELDAILPKFLAHYGINPARSEEMSLVDVVRGTLRPAPGSGKAVG